MSMSYGYEARDASPDAVTLLKNEHRQIEALFREFDAADGGRDKRRIASEICHALDVHAKIEEQVLYPRAQDIDKLKALVNEGYVEHEGLKRLIRQIPRLSTSDDFFAARMKVLKEYVQHHVREEETSTFPKMQQSELDLQALGRAMAQRRSAIEKRSRRRHSGEIGNAHSGDTGHARAP